MDGDKQNQEVQLEGSWIPNTPFKPILQKSTEIWTDQQGNRLEQANGSGSEGFYSANTQETQSDMLGSCFNPTNCNYRAGLEAIGISNYCSQTCRQFPMNGMSNSKASFEALIALADAASAVPMNAASHNIENLSLRSNPPINSNHNQGHNYEHTIPHGPAYDLNFPPRSIADTFPCKSSFQFAPVTPDKAINEHKDVAEIQYSWTNERTSQEISDLTNGIAAPGIVSNQLQTDNELQNSARDSAITTIFEDYNTEKGGGEVADLNKTPQQKPRRKKHRPRVITESKPRVRKTVSPKPTASNEKPTGKRKYVRKNASNKASITPPVEVTGELTGELMDPKIPNHAKKSCRRALNFDVEGQPRDERPTLIDAEPEAQDTVKGNQSKSTVNLGNGVEVIVKNTQAGFVYDLNHSVNQKLKDYLALPAQPPRTPVRARTALCRNQGVGSQENHIKGRDELTAHTLQENTMQITKQTNTAMSPNGFNCCSNITLNGEAQARESKRNHSSFIQQPDICTIHPNGMHYNHLSVYKGFWAHYQKKKRTEKGQNSIYTTSSFAQHQQDLLRLETAYPEKDPISNANERSLQDLLQTSSSILSQKDGTTRKRSRSHPTRLQKQAGNSHEPHSCIDALVAEMRKTLATKKRTKKRFSLVNSSSSSKNKQQLYILYNQHKFSASGPSEAIWEQLSLVDQIAVVAEQLKHLDINREEQNALVPYNIGNEMQALVLYRRDGTMVPFGDPFVHIKKQKPRPKVDLDEETNRVWKLLMGNINSEGIDGTDEEKVKWWEEERKVFQGRANSFIARMHLLQGDRRFTQWKGSVVDSVIGVFLTQNVSDHLSSSAFMSMAARFPLKSSSKCEICHDGKTGLVHEKSIVCIVDPDDTTKWNETSNNSICDQSSMTLRDTELDEEREVVNSNEFSGSSTGIISSTGIETCYESIKYVSNTEITETGKVCYRGEDKITNDAFSSQNSVVSSQNSVDTPIVQMAEREDSFSENNSEVEDMTVRSNHNSLNCSISFVELLQKVGSTIRRDVYSRGNSTLTPNQNLQDGKTLSTGNDFQSQKMDNLGVLKSSSEVFMVPSSNCHVHLSKSKVTDTEHVEAISEETRYSVISKYNGENSMKDHTAFTAESASQISDHYKLISIQEASRSPAANNPSINSIQEDSHVTLQSQSGQLRNPETSPAQIHNNEIQQSLFFPNLSGETLDVMESTSEFNKQEKNSWKTTESKVIKLSKSKGLKEINAAKRKAKSRRVGDEIKDNVDWDALRKQAEANGRKRERTAETMDSLDWEAVRCADVDEIAETIKERGMNNLLADRIKDFLNRLVREHGSIDLEWLRDIPPDKAKEYLLSIRGLGLKSVECVRLLTLHHLAFPVDTNVGRIAVRLGWVPLQPLPESLQLHLLELYPVLESIQKYLWPRLCKLDQRTLYELHYQMITFGKVFCTKSKPNCNACPMRGECRHFASAFASARLALPGPEEKGIVSATANITGKSSSTRVDLLPLALPSESGKSKVNQQSGANQQLEIKRAVSNCEPIVEEPSSPEPQCTQIIENDIEDMFYEDPDEIPTIKLNIEEFSQNLQNYMQQNMELQEADMSKALVALTAEAASLPTPKLKNVSRLRTEHHVYELPDFHPLVKGLDRREPDDPCSYLLAIWTPGETADSIQPPQGSCKSQEHGKLCDEKTCFSCNSIREANSQIVRGTLLIPCRTAMRGSFPLNGTYFQVNEVFADHDSSMNPIDVPREWLWNLPRRTVYFGTSIPSIFKGLTTEGIQHCFWRGYVCVRGFDQTTRAPRPLIARLHFPASKLAKNKGKSADDQ